MEKGQFGSSALLCQTLSFCLTCRTFARCARVSNMWQRIVRYSAAWYNIDLDVSKVTLTVGRISALCEMWKDVKSMSLCLSQIDICREFRVKKLLIWDWGFWPVRRRYNMWHYSYLNDRIKTWVALSSDVASPSISLTFHARTGVSYVSMGWTTATSPRQVARVYTGNNMRMRDHGVIMWYVNFYLEDAVLGSSASAEYGLQYVRASTPGRTTTSAHVKCVMLRDSTCLVKMDCMLDSSCVCVAIDSVWKEAMGVPLNLLNYWPSSDVSHVRFFACVDAFPRVAVVAQGERIMF